jgi:hypothetical protein
VAKTYAPWGERTRKAARGRREGAISGGVVGGVVGVGVVEGEARASLQRRVVVDADVPTAARAVLRE